MNNIKRIVLTADKPISKAIEAIQESNIKIVIIVSKKNKILGTITDGDIRRGLLKGKDLSNKCNEIMNPNPKFATVNDFENIERLLSTEKYVPIVDTDQTIKDILTSEDKIKKGNLDNPVVIMAGGEGKRAPAGPAHPRHRPHHGAGRLAVGHGGGNGAGRRRRGAQHRESAA